MKRAFVLCLTVWVGVVSLRAENPVVALPLDANQVTRVPTHPALALLVEFPGPITDYAGRGFTEDVGASAGDFLLRWGASDSYLVVAPLTEGARATLHVMMGGRSYPLELFPAGRDQAWAKVVFRDGPPAPTGSSPQANPASPTARRLRAMPKPEHPPAADPATWLSSLELLRSLRRVSAAQREAILRADPELSFNGAGFTQELGSCELRCEAILRDNRLDVLVFAVAVHNPTLRRLTFATGTLLVRCGERLYPVVASDWPTELRAGETAEVLLAIAGDGLGGRNRLAVQNTFRISLAEAHPKDPQPRPAS
ncbi:hypothetical protein [Nibricoccus sp. IMCC34717]|uniref:hypothetical protein n=1 Tax=Nibricoccus sp. IMCC34717 TaxID=3034021 RepID=UPI00384FB54E